MIVRKMDYDSRCYCGHTFDDHHHGCIMNPEYFDYPIQVNGSMGQECEHDQVNGEYFVSREKACKCNNFRPSSAYLQRLKKEWIAKHDKGEK